MSKIADRKKGVMERRFAALGVETPDVSKARADGRPQFYDIMAEDRVQCVKCLGFGNCAQYGRGEAVMNDPANSPMMKPGTQTPDGGVYTICIHHLPDDAVIFDPITDECRNKAGDNTWKEGP